MANYKDAMRRIKDIPDDFTRRLAVCSVITKAFSDRGLFEPVLVGGSVVALYTKGGYATVDLDLKSEYVNEYKEIMAELGFIRTGKDFFNGDLDAYVEFPSGKMEDSEGHMREFIVEETGLPIYAIGFEDIILDRVMRFDATKDQDAREWALRLMGSFYDDIDWAYLHRRANQLHILKVVERIQRDVKRYKGIYRTVKEKSKKNEQIQSMDFFRDHE